jgi:hypothetical protein
MPGSVAPSEQEPAHAIGPSRGPPGPVSNPEAGALDAAHAALVEALGIPDQDRLQHIVEHAREDFQLPPASSDNFVLDEVTMFARPLPPGKRRLYQALLHNFGELGVAPADGFVVLQEPPLDNWGASAGARMGSTATRRRQSRLVHPQALTTLASSSQVLSSARHAHPAASVRVWMD